MIMNNEEYQKIVDITMNSYNPMKLANEKDYVYLTQEMVSYMIEDLICEIDSLQEKYQDLIRDVEDNYKRISIEEQIDWNERW